MTNKILNKYDFHDNWVHGVTYNIMENWNTQVCLDIDYIINWPDCTTNNERKFLISKAHLKFNNISKFFINVDQTSDGFLLNPGFICINNINIEKLTTKKDKSDYFKYEIINYDEKKVISMCASEMKLELIGQPITTTKQSLTQDQRDSSISN